MLVCGSGLSINYEPQATKKFFGAAVFQKCCRGVGEQPTFAKQITKPNNEIKQKSKRESEESQLPSKSEGCNERQGFRGNCDSQGKLGMCPSLSEPPFKFEFKFTRSFIFSYTSILRLPSMDNPMSEFFRHAVQHFRGFGDDLGTDAVAG